MTLIQEKVKQATELLREFGVDCWITFTRESEICGDPTLVFLAPEHVTWHSAFIVGAGGRTRAIVGLYDKKDVEEIGGTLHVASLTPISAREYHHLVVGGLLPK